MKSLFIIIVSAIFLNGCTSLDQGVYENNQPTMTADWFTGKLTAHGIVKDRKGQVIRYFNADLTGSWTQESDGSKTGILDEQFVFNDGESQQRVWRFESSNDGRIVASANDVVEPVELYTSGNSLFLKYQLLIPYRGKTIAVTVDDRMYLVSDTVLLNESELTKWGVRVGNLQLAIIKQTD